MGLLDKVEFLLISKHPDNPEQGIFESHMHCLKKGLQAGARHILIFEDDVVFKNYQPKRIAQAMQFLENKHNWQAFFLGAISSRIRPTEVPSAVSIRYRCLAHAYVLNRQFALQFVQQSWNEQPYDALLQRQCKESYALSPMLAFQGWASSDNRTVLLDRTRRFFGGLSFIQRMNELYHKNKVFILISHGIFAIAILLLAIRN